MSYSLGNGRRSAGVTLYHCLMLPRWCWPNDRAAEEMIPGISQQLAFEYWRTVGLQGRARVSGCSQAQSFYELRS